MPAHAPPPGFYCELAEREESVVDRWSAAEGAPSILGVGGGPDIEDWTPPTACCRTAMTQSFIELTEFACRMRKEGGSW